MMIDLEMHMRKTLVMSEFRLSKNFDYLNEAAKKRFINKHQHHAIQCVQIVSDVLKQVYEFVRWMVEEVIASFIEEAVNDLRQIDWSKRDEHSQGNDDVLC